MAANLLAEGTPDLSRALNQALTRGGVAVVNLEFLAPGTFWIAPQDSKRTYIAFSLPDPTQTITICPGDDNYPNGYTIHQNESIIEFGGSLLKPLVESIWWASVPAPSFLNIIVQRGG